MKLHTTCFLFFLIFSLGAYAELNKLKTPETEKQLQELLQGHWHVVRGRPHGISEYGDISTNWRGAKQEKMVIGNRFHYVEYHPDGYGIMSWGGSYKVINQDEIIEKIDYAMPYLNRTVMYGKDRQASVIDGKSLVGSESRLKVRTENNLVFTTGEWIPSKGSSPYALPTWIDHGMQRITELDSME